MHACMEFLQNGSMVGRFGFIGGELLLSLVFLLKPVPQPPWLFVPSFSFSSLSLPRERLVPAHLAVVVCLLDLCLLDLFVVLDQNLHQIFVREQFNIARLVNILNDMSFGLRWPAFLCYFSSFWAQL